ncbi:asparagine synthetase [glutamine-hydrolyzing]-like [Gastrolobium bilobum]|uniref:asparagine synthetase [glutamine-hydrolyzing]-like n=1 Tax=Gastrolobium bilobum TaxID=150636 RepID=UPI002AAF59FF|nr:asparagine synthetase [glutamine-hydrolyzing]-like [Gastrolobium bilobum]XP_061370514.1 asparagine synthetase [glutamine-hydrolyzing]-like [Gastrolobium bilobum]
MNIGPKYKMIKREEGRIEKWVLRKGFDGEEHPYLPKRILFRQREQFSDGVGYSWIAGLKAHTQQNILIIMTMTTFLFSVSIPLGGITVGAGVVAKVA